MHPHKAKVFLRSDDDSTARNLRRILASWCDLQVVQDLKAIEVISREGSTATALVVEAPASSSIAVEESKDQLVKFVLAARQRFPILRRIVIADPDDLSISIAALHTGAIDGVLHRPFDSAAVLTALRLQKVPAVQASTADFAVR